MYQKLKKLPRIYAVLLLVTGLNLSIAFLPSSASAVAVPPDSQAGGTSDTSGNPTSADPAINGKCATGTKCGNCSVITQCDLIDKYVNPLINALAALFGVAAVTSFAIAGNQYSSSGGDPGKVTAAKNRVRNTIIALLTFLFLYALLNFLIPGGLL
jgi:hypothetical protein